MSIQDMEDLKQQYLDEMKSLINEIQIKDYRNEKTDIGFRSECEIKINELKENFNGMSIEINKKKKLQQLDTIPKKEESSVEDLVPIPSESEGISDKMCDVPFRDNSTPLKTSQDHFEILLDFNDDSTLSDDDSLYSEDIYYVDASPSDSELVSLEEVKDFDPENGEIDDDILLIKDDILHE
ncbi:hypothetical protein Tco_0932854, partial [Tanacetum coccineum]